MWQNVFEMALNNGLWAALFVALMVYVLRDTSKRERKYQCMHEENQKVILQLAENLRIVKEIKKDIDDIKGEIKSGKAEKQKRVIKRAVNHSSIVGIDSY